MTRSNYIEYIFLMFLPEHEAKQLLREVGIPVPNGHVVSDPAELRNIEVTYPTAVKAQVAAGGRGKAGGIRPATSEQEAGKAISAIVGQSFSGEIAHSVLLEPWVTMQRELYLSLAIDGNAGGFAVLYAPEGGMEVESSSSLVRYAFGIPENFRAHEFRAHLAAQEPNARVREHVVALARRLLDLAVRRDCLTIEINPLALLPDGQLLAADAKIMLDEAAAFRSRQLTERIEADWKNQPEVTRRCLEARLMLVQLDGDVGLISGGAGMTMAAMDMVSEYGGSPACFLDCSANPTPEGYRLAFELLDADQKVRVILVSIFGGATQMDRVARVMRQIMEDRGKRGKPVVFRLNGTHAEMIPEIFEPAQLWNHETLEDAVAAATRVARESTS